jgi:hypothetical protein
VSSAMGRRRRVAHGREGVQLALVPVLYGLDIETDTTLDGLDPTMSSVVAVAVDAGERRIVFTGPERRLLRDLDRWLGQAPPGVLVTWNGAGFDLPFLADRARALRVRLGLELHEDAAIVLRHDPLTGHHAAYRARWYRHLHLDACCLYRALHAGEERSFGLKRVAVDCGLHPVEVDASRIHELTPDELRRYVASDAALARQLAERRWLDAGAHLDAVVLRPPA